MEPRDYETPERALLEVVIGASPSGPNLFPEVRLVKPAILYADRTRILSPMATLLGGVAAMSTAEGAERAVVMQQIAEAMGDPASLELMRTAEALLSVRSMSRKEQRRLLGGAKFKEVRELADRLDESWEALREKVGAMLEEAGAGELEIALESGLVEVEHILARQEDFEDIFIVFLLKLGEVLASGEAYPLFDDKTGSLVSSGVAQGLIAPSKDSLSRGKQVGAAAELMSHLPAFPHATVSEVLDIREELSGPLVRFRAAMVRIARLIDTAQHEPDFRSTVEQEYRSDVAPAIQEIRDRVEANKYLQQLLGEASKDIPRWLGKGVLAIALAQVNDVYGLATAGIAAVEPAAKAAWVKHVESREIRQHQYYFLYETDRLLSRPGV